ncbi:hypothetical protein B0H12DRAFT_414016 [Mycena haematopus]|nr:hypothetical protein B0H12DRAFT_414016 [Mycena haematopus]
MSLWLLLRRLKFANRPPGAFFSLPTLAVLWEDGRRSNRWMLRSCIDVDPATGRQQQVASTTRCPTSPDSTSPRHLRHICLPAHSPPTPVPLTFFSFFDPPMEATWMDDMVRICLEYTRVCDRTLLYVPPSRRMSSSYLV